MVCKKISIIGCGGSGKSTLSIKLGRKLNIPVVHLDQIFWTDNWVPITKEEFDEIVENELKKDKWIIDGNYNRTIQKRFEESDTIIYLDFPTIICIFGVIKRVISNYGKTRIDMADNCPEKFNIDFLKWVWNFNKKNRNKYLNMLKKVEGKKIYILHNRQEVRKLLDTI
ncbi:DNA topology modulation protein [uncultured Clostridium sp.]|uniref:DNA topology modulation protein n=1 Tax=uncultured Clostridium sp. TaxID=59620 RepID=UPI0025FAFF94|nr:DNA topology modulation protein [uncultured Clostridium sp.]